MGSIVGSAFFLLIFLSGYFFYTLSNQGVAAQQQTLGEMRNFDIQRSQETLQQYGTVIHGSNDLIVEIKNNGPKPQNIVCIGFWDGVTWNYFPEVTLYNDIKTLPFLIESGGYCTIDIITPGIPSPLPPNLPLGTYKIQFITERGLIFSVSFPENP